MRLFSNFIYWLYLSGVFMKLKLSSDAAQFFSNFFIWAMFCAVVLMDRWKTGESSPLHPITSSDSEALTHYVDLQPVIYISVAFVLLYFIVSFINHRLGTKEGESNMHKLLDSVLIEMSNVFLSLGSLLISIAYFISDPSYAFGGFAAWLLWGFIKPKRRT